MLQLTRHQQKAFLFECLSNIKRLYLAYASNGLIDLDIIKDGQIVLNIPSDNQAPVAKKLRALISIYNKVAQVNFDQPRYQKYPVAEIEITEESTEIFSLLVSNEVEVDQSLMEFLVQFHYPSWLMTNNGNEESVLKMILEIRKRTALDDVVELLKSGEYLNEIFTGPAWLSDDFLEDKKKKAITFLQAIYQYKQNYYREGQEGRCHDLLVKSFNNSQLIKENLTAQEELILGSIIQHIEFFHGKAAGKLDEKIKLTEAYKISIRPISQASALNENQFKDTILPLLRAISANANQPKPVVTEVPRTTDEAPRTDDAEKDEIESVDVDTKSQKCCTQYKYGYFAYNPGSVAIEVEGANGYIKSILKQTADPILLTATDQDIFKLQWPKAIDFEIKRVAADDTSALKVMCHDVEIPIEYVADDGSQTKVGQIRGSLELTYQIKENDDHTSTYELIQAWTDDRVIYDILIGEGLTSTNILIYHLDDKIKPEFDKETKQLVMKSPIYPQMESKAKKVAEEREEQRIVSQVRKLEDRLGQNTINDELPPNKNYASLLQTTQKLARKFSSFRPQINTIITEVETLYSDYYDDTAMVGKLNSTLHAVNEMMICQCYVASLKNKHADFSQKYSAAAARVDTQIESLQANARAQRLRTALFIFVSTAVIAAAIVSAVFTAGLSLGLIATPIILAASGVGFFGGFAGEVIGIRKAVNSHHFFNMSKSMRQLKSEVIPDNPVNDGLSSLTAKLL